MLNGALIKGDGFPPLFETSGGHAGGIDVSSASQQPQFFSFALL